MMADPADRAGPDARRRGGYHHGDLRSALIATVADLVETHGAEDFSIAEAARLAGVSSGAPYRHFRDRAEILRGVVKLGMDDLRTRMEAGAAGHPEGSIEAIAAIGEAYVAFARARPGLFRLAFGLTQEHGEDEGLRQAGEDCFAVVRRAVAACSGQPLGSPFVEQSSYILRTVAHGHAFLCIDGKNADQPLPDDHPLMLEVARRVVGRR